MPEGTPFEKWPFERKVKFILKFKEAYCKEYSLNSFFYQLKEESLKDVQDYDFTLYDPKNNSIILKAQHTYAGSDVDKEYIKPNNLEDVIEILRNNFKDKKGFFVSINMPDPPATTEDKRKLAYWLTYIIGNNVQDLKRSFLFRYKKEDEEYFKEISKWVDSIDVVEMGKLDKVVFGYGSFKINEAAVLPDDIRTDMAVGHKEEKYSNPQDLVLIIHFSAMPVSDFYIPVIIDKHSKTKFKGLWLFDEWNDNFLRVK